jgi:hypothetical protein
MQEQDRDAARVARFLPVHRVPGVELEDAAAVRLDGREQVLLDRDTVSSHTDTV